MESLWYDMLRKTLYIILFTYNFSARNLLRVSFRDSDKGQSHTLMSNDEHDKRQWLLNLRQAITECQRLVDSSVAD